MGLDNALHPQTGRDNLTGPTSPLGSGTVADFRVYASETVPTLPGSVPQLIF